MKIQTFLITIIVLFFLTSVTSCESQEDICTFNVDDPINDLEWLKNKIPTTTSPDYSFSYYLYQNKKNPDKYYFIQEFGNNIILAYSSSTIYNCKGDQLMMKGIEGPPPTGWDKFFEENKKIKMIWPK